ncbi:hypothetical protein ACS0TY_024189 [Phlomoides rotata]
MGIVKTWKNAVMCLQVASFVLIAMVAIETLYPTQDNYNNIVRVDNNHQLVQKEGEIVDKSSPIPRCNFFSGKWVYDNVSYPLYKEGECSFMGDQFTSCEKYGRKDFNYQNWRWQPHHCDIPRFNGIALLEKIRGKKLVFVGDSLGRNQWESMLCLIESYLPPLKSRKLQLKSKGNLYKFHFIEYDVTIGFYWAPLLVESNCDDPEHHRAIRTRIIRTESIEKHGRHWLDADILVFDSFAWWTAPTMTILWGSFDSPDAAIYKEVGMNLRRYEIALNSWSEWLEIHINRTKTKMFFMSHSPFHFGYILIYSMIVVRRDTRRKKNFCYNQTEPIFDETYWPSSVMRSLIRIPESIIEKLEQRGVKVEYMNITQLSGYRKDGHPSIFRNFTLNISLEELIRDSHKYSDCMHWCLPGVPDVWNQILYSYIMKS